jgi:predicted AAA+ superfamily ATPase
MILYINDYIEQINKANGEIVLFLDSISFTEGKKSEL